MFVVYGTKSGDEYGLFVDRLIKSFSSNELIAFEISLSGYPVFTEAMLIL